MSTITKGSWARGIPVKSRKYVYGRVLRNGAEPQICAPESTMTGIRLKVYDIKPETLKGQAPLQDNCRRDLYEDDPILYKTRTVKVKGNIRYGLYKDNAGHEYNGFYIEWQDRSLSPRIRDWTSKRAQIFYDVSRGK